MASTNAIWGEELANLESNQWKKSGKWRSGLKLEYCSKVWGQLDKKDMKAYFRTSH